MKYSLSYLFLLTILLSTASCGLNKKNNADSIPEGERYKLAVCDWMILKRQKIGAFQLAHEIGADGLELDMGGLGKRDSFDNKLREPHFQILFKEKASEFDIELSSIAMSGFYAQSLVGRDNYRDLIQDCLQTMKAMGVKTAFLPLGTEGDLIKKPEIRPEMVRRLRTIGDMAAKDSLTVGIETSLDAQGEVELLEEINSPGIKIYFNFQNPLEAGRDVYKELRVLGKDRICQIHCTDTDGVTLPNNKRLNMRKIKETLDDMGWSGWLVVERSRDANDVRNVKGNFSANVAYLREVFN
ncbi:sugar phosphate isomerase/epimerase family protein [Bacteroides sp. 224]|uniref:sugar phosphate isomerase/epimerase family protein n=1 Tax=Bacteroides sp. 224 TaxID=2302936 RepID=UPI0013D54889|nr:sugar phosphate isomerase/epimerase family protein [Bacteroides sp. 224]NDV64069.1 sugar phosphate isomerase/epimerase [Bacteroides sp. 224]